MKKIISILGSTGSIGQTTLSIIEKKKNKFEPYFFSANENYKLICKQIKKYKPKYFLIYNEKVYKNVKNKFTSSSTKIINRFQLSLIKKKSDISVIAISGIAGLYPTIHMIKKSKKILIANKESIICGWNLIKKYSKNYKTKIIPIDSEHYSINKLLENIDIKKIKKIYLTASGGPFLNYKKLQLQKIKPENALKHPKWKMGKKITIDSATLMNKVLEYIEAQKLFKLSNDKLDILIHPESLVHAIIKLKNGLTEFLYHDTTMVVPIANAIFENNLDIDFFLNSKTKISNLTFKIPDPDNFPLIKILKRANEHPSTPIIINAANEVLVQHFLAKKIPFLGISSILKMILNDRNYRKIAVKVPKDLNQIIKIDSWTRNKTIEKIKLKYA